MLACDVNYAYPTRAEFADYPIPDRSAYSRPSFSVPPSRRSQATLSREGPEEGLLEVATPPGGNHRRRRRAAPWHLTQTVCPAGTRPDRREGAVATIRQSKLRTHPASARLRPRTLLCLHVAWRWGPGLLGGSTTTRGPCPEGLRRRFPASPVPVPDGRTLPQAGLRRREASAPRPFRRQSPGRPGAPAPSR